MRGTVVAVDLNAAVNWVDKKTGQDKSAKAVKLSFKNEKGELKNSTLAFKVLSDNETVLNTLSPGDMIDIKFTADNSGMMKPSNISKLNGDAVVSTGKTGPSNYNKGYSDNPQIARSVGLKGAIEHLNGKDATSDSVLALANVFTEFVLNGYSTPAPTTTAKKAVKKVVEVTEDEEEDF